MKSSHPEVTAAHRANPGETLRLARESRDLALADVAAQLNLTAQALRNLEAGEFDRLPGHTFARGYVRAYARLLGLEADQLVSEFDHYTGTDSAGSSVASLSRIEGPAKASQRLVKWFSVVALVALCVIGFLWWQAQHQHDDIAPQGLAIEHVEVEGADGTTEIHPLAEPEDQAAAAALAEMPGVEPSTAVAPQPAETPVTVPETAVEPARNIEIEREAEAAQVGESADTASVSAPAPAAGEASIRLQFSADCWTQLTDAEGKVLLSAVKHRGDALELVGKAPLELRLGYARGASVQVNGQPVDIAPFIQGETARLKLGQ